MKAGRKDLCYSLSASEITAHHSYKINNPTFMPFPSYSEILLFCDSFILAGLAHVLQHEEAAQVDRIRKVKAVFTGLPS